MSNLKAVVHELEDQIAKRIMFLKTLAAMEVLGSSLGIRLIAEDLRGTKKESKNGPVKTARGKRTLSPAARKRIADAQKKRWAKYHAEQKKAAK